MARGKADCLVSGAGSAGAHCASSFTWINVAALTATLCPSNIREHFLIRNIVRIHAVADGVVVLRTSKNAGHGARRYIGYVVRNAAAIGETGSIASQQAPY